ncbi:MAG: hypothetical protein ACT4PJ_17070 [Gemmatimonadaceae bacterium]
MRNGRMRAGGLDVEIVEGIGVRREQCEREALDAGLPLPLSHTLAWARACGDTDALLVVLRASESCAGVIAIERSRSRSLPGHQLWRGRRVGAAIAPEAYGAAARALAMLAQTHPRVLRVSLELFERDTECRSAFALALADVGFRTSPAPRSYSETLVLDLTVDGSALFESLPAKTRRDIRAAAKHGLEVRPITQVSLAPRLDDLLRETMARSGGVYRNHDWNALIELSELHPARLRIVGLFRSTDSGANELLAFAVGCGHGDHAEYSVAGSTRVPDLKVPLAYAVLWDLVKWAKGFGATWFDFGGVTPSKLAEDSLGGISDFKRYFSKEQMTVGEEWVLEPRKARAGLANVVSASAAWFTAVRARA